MVVLLLSWLVGLQTLEAGAGTAIPGYEGQVREIIDRALKQYHSAQSYQDKLLIETDLEAEGDTSLLGPNERQEFTLSFTRPNRIALQTPVYSLFCDGKKMWQQIMLLEQYVEMEVPKQLNLDTIALSELNFYAGLRHPVADTLTKTDSAVKELFGEVTKFTGAQSESLAAKPGHRVKAVMKVQVGQERFETAPFEAWFSQDSGLLGEIRVDATELFKAQVRALPAGVPRPDIKRYVRRLRFENVALNQPTPDDRFVFKPGAYDDKVSQFRIPGNGELQQRLVGRPAPAFKGKDLNGKDLSLADLKGRVVVLDFWSRSCYPCIMAMPDMQALADKYAGKPVSVVGVNSDGPRAKDQVSDILKRNKVTFQQFLDPADEVARAYRITNIPCVALIDKQGVLQVFDHGYSPGKHLELAQKIDRLLKGENLFPPKGSGSR